MDQQLLSALDNLSVALEKIGEALASKGKETSAPTADALKGGGFVDNISKIHQGVIDLKKDTAKILSNQQTILAMSKQKGDKMDAAEKLGQDKNKQKFVKDGLGIIMLMAVAILALGVAFKLVGSVNFLSVIAISGAILLLSMAFANVQTVLKKVGFTPKDGINFVLAVVSISIGIASASWILSTVRPIGLGQLFTTLFLAGSFAIIAHGMNQMLGAFKGKSPKEIAMAVLSLPIILPAIALGIALSSYALQLVRPIGLGQFFTTLFIASAFTVIAYGMNKMLDAFKGKNPKEIAMAVLSLPIILPAIALGIAASSWALQMVTPITLAQFFTTLFIAATFAVIALSLNTMITSFKGMDIKDIGKLALGLVIVLPAIALAITLSSWILSKATPLPIGDLFKIAILGFVLAGIALVLSPALAILSKISIGDMLKGGLAVVIIAAAIMVSSLILSLGNYDKYPTFDWALGVGLSLLAFSPAIVVLGFIAMSGIGALAILAGAGMVLVVAASIVGASHILALGNYGNHPTLDWASGVGIVMTVFGFSMLTLGVFILSTFGLGFSALKAGSDAVFLIANTIVASADIFRKGNFTGGPTKEWAEGVALAIGSFSPVYAMLMANSIFKIFGGGGVGPDDFASAIRVIATGIVDAANFFNGPGAKAAFSGGPTKDWAEGVGLAIGAFAPVYSVLAANSGWFKSGVSVDDMKSAIMTISQGIVDAANFFGKNIASFDLDKIPSKEWGEGVGAAIGAFVPVFQQMSKDSGWFTSGEDVVNQMSGVILGISHNIADVSNALSRGDYSRTIPENWMKNATTSILQFSALTKVMNENRGGGLAGIVNSLLGRDPIAMAADGIVELSKAYSKLAKSMGEFSGVIGAIDADKLNSFKSLTGNLALLSMMDAELFGNMLDKLEDKAGSFSDIVKEFNKQQTETPGAVVGRKESGAAVTTEKKSESVVLGEKLDRIAASLADIQTVVGSNGSLKSYMDSLGKETHIGGGNAPGYR
jgi:hypothetical protein